MKNRIIITLSTLSVVALLVGGCGVKSPADVPNVPSTAQPSTLVRSDESEPFLYDSHAECAAIQPSGEYCDMHGGHMSENGVWIEPTQISREEGLTGITVAIIPSVDAALDQPGNGPDLSGMKGRTLPFAITLDTHVGDISEMDLNGRVFLKDATGTEIPGMARQTYESGHHPVYVVAFPKRDSNGASFEEYPEQLLTVVIRGVGAIPERMLQVRLEPRT